MSITTLKMTDEAILDIVNQNMTNMWELLGIRVLDVNQTDKGYSEYKVSVHRFLPEHVSNISIMVERKYENNDGTIPVIIYTARPISDGKIVDDLCWSAYDYRWLSPSTLRKEAGITKAISV